MYSSSAKTFRSSAGRPSGPSALRFANARIVSSTSYLDGTSSSGQHEGYVVKAPPQWADQGSATWCQQFMEPPHPPLPEEGIVPQQPTFLIFDVLRIKHPLLFPVQCLEMFAEAKLINFSDTPFLRVG